MNFDVGAIQNKHLNPFDTNGLRLKVLFDLVEDAEVNPVTKAAVDAVPVAELFRQGTPFTSVFGNVLQGLKKAKVVNLNIAALLRKQMLNTRDTFLCPFHHEL